MSNGEFTPDDPKPIDEILKDPDAVVGFRGDQVREQSAEEDDLLHERQALEADREDLLDVAALQEYGEDPQFLENLQDRGRDFLSTMADEDDIERKKEGK